MSSPCHPPFGMDRNSAPFDDGEEGEMPTSLTSPMDSHRAPRSAHELPAAAGSATAMPPHSESSLTHASQQQQQQQQPPSSTSGSAQHRLSEQNFNSSTALETSLLSSSTPRHAGSALRPPRGPPTPPKADTMMDAELPMPLREPNAPEPHRVVPVPPSTSSPHHPHPQQQQHLQKKPLVDSPVQLATPSSDPLLATLPRQVSAQSAPDASVTTLPPTATTRRTVGFVSGPASATTTTAPPPAPLPSTAAIADAGAGASTSTATVIPMESLAGQSSSIRTEPHESVANNLSDTRGTTRPSEVDELPRQKTDHVDVAMAKEEDAAFLAADATEPTVDKGGEPFNEDEEDDEDDLDATADTRHHSSSSHARKNKAYANLVIMKPSTSETPDAFVTTGTPAAAAQDANAEAQIRAAGTGGSALLPVFDRAKQVLLTPGPRGAAASPRLRQGRVGSKGTDGPFSTTTPRSTAAKHFSMLITPLLRTPIHRQQSSGISSPLVVDRSVLEEPARSPATFGDRLKEMKGDDDDTKTHMVWQMRQGMTKSAFSPSFLLVSVGDRVNIHWYDSAEEIFETDHTYLKVVPGGRHSCYNSSTPQDDEEGNAMSRETVEMQHVWAAAAPEDGAAEQTSHVVGYKRANAGYITVPAQQQPQRDANGNQLAEDAEPPLPSPLVIRVHTPQPTRTDSLNNVSNPIESGSVTPLLTRQGIRARRLASEVFLTRDDAEVDASNGVSARSNPAAREVNMFASNVTPTMGNQSRQTSTSWMLQRSASRRSLGENYQSFTVAFDKPGDYYFVSSKHKRSMRLHVQVKSERSLVAWRYVFSIVAAVVVVALIVIVVVVLAYWMHHSTYLFGEGDTATYEQYLAFLDIHDLITMKLFPFLATGVLIVLLVILSAIAWSVYRCFRPARQGSYTRGVYASTRHILGLGTILLTFGLIVLLFVAFGLELNVTNGVNQLAQSIGTGVTSTLNLYSTAVLQVNYVVEETGVLFPNITLPTAQIYSITSQVTDLMNDVVKWTSFIEDIAQVAFRAIPVIIYLAMQLGLFAACLTIGALILNFRKAAVATTWILAASLGIFSIVCGIEFTITKLFSTIYSSVVVLRDDPSGFGESLGLANNSFVSQLLSYCTISVSDVSVITDYVSDILKSINSTLDAQGQEEFASIIGFIEGVVPNSLEALANFTDYMIANLDNIQKILDDNSYQVDELLHVNAVPLLKTVMSIIQTFEGLVNCQVIRDIVATAIPVFRNEVQNYNLAVFSFLLIIFGVSFILLVFAVGSTYALRHPRKTWCNMRTGRWFRFRYSYKTHVNTLLLGTATKAKEKTVLQWLVHHTEPFMSQLRTVKLVCYAGCALMFFDSILIVLFNEVSRGTKTSKMLQALSYLGCAVLFFLLLAALFRRAFIRWIFHACSLLCAAACLGVSVSQAIVGFVYFGQCVDHTRYEMSALTYGSPVYMTCSATYMGYNLEVAIYAIIIFFNSITVVVTLAILLRYEQNLKASFQHRHYVGILSPLEKFFPWLRCIFADYLFVKRIYHGFLIFVIVVFLVCFAVLDIGQWSVIRNVSKNKIGDSDIVQVIDPTVGCNGDPRYCDMRANEIIWACAHNAHSSLEDGFVLPNHYYNISHQLTAGIRSFMVDVWYDKINSSISDEQDVYVCHTVCLMGRRRWRDIAREFKVFLDTYPEQIIMIIFEQYVNSSDLGKISDEVGLTQYVWYSDQKAPNFNPDYQWPTLRQLINKGQRAMMYNDELATADRSRDCPEWLYYSFDFQYENYYQTDSVDDWVCDIHRGWCTPNPTVVVCNDSASEIDPACEIYPSSSLSSSSSSSSSSSGLNYTYLASLDITNCTEYGANMLWQNGSAVYNKYFNTNPPNVRSKMSTMNHFITNGAGSPVQATKANQVVQVQSTTYMCSSTWNTVVNILAFDFWNIANPLGTIQAMNQNLAKYGSRYNYQNQWSKMLFGTDTVNFDDS